MGGEMTQTMYAHVNKRIKKKSKRCEQWYILPFNSFLCILSWFYFCKPILRCVFSYCLLTTRQHSFYTCHSNTSLYKSHPLQNQIASHFSPFATALSSLWKFILLASAYCSVLTFKHFLPNSPFISKYNL
jgi:hypothetical protein